MKASPANIVHAQLLESAEDYIQANPNKTSPLKSFIPRSVAYLKENPLTNPIPQETDLRTGAYWKTQAGIGIAAFFLGASFAIIGMLYLY